MISLKLPLFQQMTKDSLGVIITSWAGAAHDSIGYVKRLQECDLRIALQL